MKSLSSGLITLAVVVLWSLADRPLLGQVTNITGMWSVSVTTTRGTGMSKLVLQQNGGKVTGQYESQYGQADLSGAIKGNAFTFTFTLNLEGQPQKFIYAGVAEKEQLTGKVTLPGVVEGTFVAKRE